MKVKRWELGIADSKAVVPELTRAAEPPGGFVRADWWAPALRVPASGGLEWGLRICISNKFPGDVTLLIQRPVGEPLP